MITLEERLEIKHRIIVRMPDLERVNTATSPENLEKHSES